MKALSLKVASITKLLIIIKKFSTTFPREALLPIYISFIRPHSDYGDTIYDKLSSDFFSQKIENVQYKTYLAITGAMQGTSPNKLYQELGLESISDKWWCRKLVFFYKVIDNLSPTYLTAYLSNNTLPSSYNTRISYQRF